MNHAVPLAQDSLDSSERLHETSLDSTGTPGMDVSIWLRDLGLEDYVQAFQAKDIDAEVLPRLTADDLTALGITSIGHRRNCSTSSPLSTAEGRRQPPSHSP